MCVSRHAQSTQNNKFAYLCIISAKMWGMKLNFCLQINTTFFYKLIVSTWMCVARHAQNTQNSKFGMSLQYLKKEVRDEVDFLHGDKHQSFLQFDFSTLGVKFSYKAILSSSCPSWSSILKILKVTSLWYFHNISKKKLEIGFIFCIQINIYKLVLLFLMKWPDMSKVPKILIW